MPDDEPAPLILPGSTLRLAPLDEHGNPDMSRACTFWPSDEPTPAIRAPRLTLRIVPLRPDGDQDLRRGRTFMFDEPLTLTLGSARPHIDIERGPARVPELLVDGLPPAPPGPAWITHPDHPQPMDLAALARYIRWHKGAPAAVETWTEGPSGTWTHTVIPRCRPRDADEPTTDTPRAPADRDAR
ncbi:hypothetical protein [Embleya sp. NPDC001921]